MRFPSRCRSTFIVWAAGLFFTGLIAAKETPRATPDSDKKQPPPLLLANVWNPSIDPTGWWMSEKFDGLRAYWDGRQLWSRQGHLIHAPEYFRAELPDGVPLDGELWIGRSKFEETMSIVRAETPDARWKAVHYMVFDAPQVKGTFEERMRFLRATLPDTNRFLKMVVQKRCEGKEQLLAERDRVVREGGEGLMLRQPESHYEAGRSPTLLKVKPFDDAEATVVGHNPGKGKYDGKLGSLRVRTDDGREFSIGSGLNDALREAPPPIGTVITYRFRGLTAKGLPRFPSFLRVRKD